MDRLINWRDLRQEDLPDVEGPFFAVVKVKNILASRTSAAGVDALLRSCNLPPWYALQVCDHNRVLKRIEKAEWLLLTQPPFSPLSGDRSGQYRHLLNCPYRDHLDAGTVSHLPLSGPGKWRTQSIRNNRVRNALAFTANRLTSSGDEGRLWLSEGKDYANTTRVVIQQWVPLDEHDKGVASSSVSRNYGESREIPQIYVEADDNWQISGKSWHWVPVLANEVYEYKDGIS